MKLARFNAGPLDNSVKAFEFAKRARELAPTDAGAAAILGEVAFQSGNFTWAYSLLKEGAPKLPDDISVLRNLARAAYSVGRVAEARKVMQRVLLRDDAEDNPDKAIAGYNKFVKVSETNCKSGTLVVMGKPISEEAAASTLNCKCGNGVCGEGENAVNCPTDCAAKFGYLFLCRIAPWFLYPLLFILLLVSAVYAYRSIKRHKRTKTGNLLLLLTGVLAVLFLLMQLLCKTIPLIAYLILTFNAAMLLFTQLHLQFRGVEKHKVKPVPKLTKPKPAPKIKRSKSQFKLPQLSIPSWLKPTKSRKPVKQSIRIDNKSVKALERVIKNLQKKK